MLAPARSSVRTLFAWIRRDVDNALAAIAAPLLVLLLAGTVLRKGTEPEPAKPPLANWVRPQDEAGAQGHVELEMDPANEAAEDEPLSDWSEATDQLAQDPDYDRSQTICRTVRSRQVPTADRPGPSLARSLSGCSAVSLYYDTVETRDPVRARQCALSDQSSDLPFERQFVLMNVYANAEGVRRDMDLAIHLACGLDTQPEEMHYRVLRLHRLREEGWTGNDFDYVIDDRSSFSGASGVYYYLRLARERRANELRALTGGWPASHRTALTELVRAKDDYADAHGHAAHYHASPAGWIYWSGVEDVEDTFIAELRTLVSNGVPDYSSVEIEATRRRLAYNHARSQQPGDSFRERGPADFDRAERAWRRYRDAFIAVARLRLPGMSRARLATWLGRTRPDRWSLDSSLDLGSTTLPFDMDPADRLVGTTVD
ncbi:hypothetical protein [Sphingosinicella terrae]|uniref:hypothetical protein n=1 Tax=Sphingosinicella terrae TaxID=2172047 RepID=UPI0013B45517|nr:hypothetical protein [Sphingosinicella terrae]